MKIKNIAVLFSLASITFISSCKKDKGEENELITTVKIELTNKADASDKITVQWKDADGPGGNNPSTDSLLLKEGVTYTGKITVLDESSATVDDITKEIEEKKNIHQFFYLPDAALSSHVEVLKTDQDSNNPPLPVGLTFELTVKPQSSGAAGQLEVILSHYDGVKKSVDRSPESDVDIQFPVRVR